jgi:hypothetical protein
LNIFKYSTYKTYKTLKKTYKTLKSVSLNGPMRKLAATTLPNFIFSVLPLLNFFNGDKGTVQRTKINIVGGECPYITLTPAIMYDNTL